MSSVQIALIAMGCLSAAVALGMLLNKWLPTHHLTPESKETIRLGAGLITTMSALVLGFLVSSAKGTFDTATSSITHLGAKTVMLHGVLVQYGSETQGIRQAELRALKDVVAKVWPESQQADHGINPIVASPEIDEVMFEIDALKAATDRQRALKAQAVGLSNDILLTRWGLIEQLQNRLPAVFIVLLVGWLSLLFVSFGLFAPRKTTPLCFLLASAMSVAGAIFVIHEMNQPLVGSLKVSNAPLVKAIEIMESGTSTGPTLTTQARD